MASPDPVRPHEDVLLAQPDGAGVSRPIASDGVVMDLAELPHHQHTTDADLLTAVHERDPLAFVELYQRTAPAAHAVARRLLTRTAHVESALREVYAELWAAPPDGGSLVQWVRARTFAVAAGLLRHRGEAPAEPSSATLLDDLPAPDVRHLNAVERSLAALPDAARRAVLLAHDAGVPTAQQPDPDAADDLELGLLAIADPGSSSDTPVASGVPGLGDWALGLLPESEATAVAASVRSDAVLAARCAALHLARRRLEGLPASPNTSQRILAHVLAVPPALAVAPAPAAADIPRQKPPARGGIGLVAASLALVLLAGVLMLAERGRGEQQVAVAQAAAVVAPTPLAAPPARDSDAAPQRLVPRQRRRPTPPPPILRPAPSAPQIGAAAPPVRVTVPTMNVDERLVSLSVLGDGTLAAPDDYGTPGWYRDGVAPGDVGPAVIVGHVDSMDGPAVFFELQTLKRGDKAHVKRADGTTVTFVVDRVERYAKAEFPTDQVYGPTPGSELRLITCGGAFDNTTLSYDDNVVAYAHLQQPRTGANARNQKDKQDNKNKNGKNEKNEKNDKVREADESKTYDHLGRLRTTPEDGGQRARQRDRRNSETAGDA